VPAISANVHPAPIAEQEAAPWVCVPGAVSRYKLLSSEKDGQVESWPAGTGGATVTVGAEVVVEATINEDTVADTVAEAITVLLDSIGALLLPESMDMLPAADPEPKIVVG